MMKKEVSIKNKKAKFEYELLDKYTAGIQLFGTEIKSIRNNNARISESFCEVKDGEVYVVNMNIDEYKYGTHYNHEPKRTRKLLLNKKEIKKIIDKTKDKGMTIVPTKLFLNDKGWAKLNIAVAKGKKLYDKRNALKERDSKRDIDRARKYNA